MTTKTNKYLPFDEAKEFVRSLNLQTGKEWTAYCSSGLLPTEIPKTPRVVYKNQGWQSMGDWLGSSTVSNVNRSFRSFDEARKFVRGLGLESYRDWIKYSASESRPLNIPGNPRKVYENDGWKSWGDWLGSDIRSHGNWRLFEEARSFVQSLGLKSREQWNTFVHSDQRPKDIPVNPDKIYRDIGWVSFGDWLGTGRIANFNREFLSFELAREVVQGLGLKNEKEWKEYCGSGSLPENIPAKPYRTYKNKGWVSLGDWLGTGRVANFNKEYLSYDEARKFALGLDLNSGQEWYEYSMANELPNGIPSRPAQTYKGKGWTSMGDWLGTGRVANRSKVFLPYHEAKEYVHSLKIKTQKEWGVFRLSGNLPDNIPSNPQQAYEGVGWVSWGDWLGYIGDGSHQWSKSYMVQFIQSLQQELTYLEAVELITIINSNNLAKKLKELGSLEDLVSTQGGSEQRKEAVQEILTKLGALGDEGEGALESGDETEASQFAVELEVSEVSEITETTEEELLPFDPIGELRMYDNTMITASLDDENIEFLMKNQLKKIWNRVLNGEVEVEDFRGQTGGKNFTIIKDWFFKEYEEVQAIVPPRDYIFKYQPNLMQKLVSYRLIKEKRYGNWSGTGAGKTLSAIFSGRLAGAKNSVIICNNSTVEGWVNSIHEYFDNSRVYTKKFLDYTPQDSYVLVDKYDVHLEPDINNYLVLNYETFQLQDGEYIVSELLKNNTIDYIILDEVQNVKQRDDAEQSSRRSVVNKLIIHSKDKNPELLVMAMSATPVINNLTEPKKLIELLSGESHDELETNESIINGVEMYKALTRYGLRFRPDYGISVNEELIETDGTELSDQILKIPKGAVVEFEKVLLQTKLNSIKPMLKKGTLVYTHYVTELSQEIGDYIKALGFSVGYYTGEDKGGLRGFKQGDIDVLVGSAPIGTGVDGIQKVCNTLIPIVLPWTSSEYDQLVGRVNRQGSNFDKVNIYIPQVVIPLGDNIWSWDKRRHNIIKFKASLADLAVDGRVPKNLLPPKAKLIEQAKQELAEWIQRLQEDDVITFEREELMIPLNPKQIAYKRNQLGDFSELNRTWNTTRSGKTHNRLKNDPSEWYYYHSLYTEKRKTWSEIPYLELAKKLKGRPDWVVADFGCGENLMAAEVECKVHAFDHVAISEDVTACDMSHVPLADSSVDASVFSLSLMGSNYLDYLIEAHRVLKPYGNIFICEPASRWDGKEDKLINELKSIGFKVFDTIRNTESFIYIEGLKV